MAQKSPVEHIRERLDAGAHYVKLRSDVFVRLAKQCNPNEDSADDVERSMAKTLRLRDGKHVDVINVNPKVAKRLLQPHRNQRDKQPAGGGDKQPGGKDGDK